MRKTIKSIAAAALALSLAALPVVQDMPALQGTSIGIIANAAECAVHNYDGQNPAYKWSMDNSSCTASVKCSNCDYVLTSSVSASFEVTKRATATAKGKKTCEAAFNSPFETQYKVAEVDNYNHIAVSIARQKVESALYALADEGSRRTYANRITLSEVEAAVNEAVAGLGVDAYQIDMEDSDIAPGYCAVIVGIDLSDEAADNYAIEFSNLDFRYYAPQSDKERKIDEAYKKIRNAARNAGSLSEAYDIEETYVQAVAELQNAGITADYYFEVRNYGDYASVSSGLYADDQGDNYGWTIFAVPDIYFDENHTVTENGSKIATAKYAVNNALAKLTVNNDTSEAAVQSAVNAAIASTGVTGVSGNAKLTLTKATDKAAGSAAITVTLTAGNESGTVTQNGYSIAKLASTTPEKTDEEKAAEAKSALESSWLQNGDSSSWLNEKDIAYKEADVHFADTAADILKEKGITAEVTPAGFTKADSDGYVTFTFKIKVGDAETACDIKMKVAVDASAPDAPVTSDKEMAQSAANAFKNTWVYKDPGTQDWITAEDIEKGTHNQTVFAGTWLEGVDLKGASVTVKSEMLDKSKGTAKLTYTFTAGSESVSVETTLTVKAEEASKPDPTPAPVITYYAVGFTGDYAGSGITVSSLSNTAGSTVTVNVPVGYSVSVISGGSRIASVSDGTGTFTMPNGNVTLSVTSYLGTLTAGYKNAYIYSYDSEMNHIATNSVRGGMKSPEGEVTVKLGKKYAGKSVTLYNGRKSTSSKVDEAVLDKNGQATFTVKSGKNYTLAVE